MPNVSCAVYKCTNNDSKLRKYKRTNCEEHDMLKGKFIILHY